ncbi:MAG TPA: Ig-like domain-containing protein [Candidatus Sulfotelmatobacter sp.]|nr:Ig-like domain-containing protein [Candidatus Sulfotelmatobacter sp.]
MIVLLLGGGLAHATPTPESFYSYYWLGGNVSFEGAPAVNKEVRLLRDGKKIKVTTDRNGAYEFNIYDLEYFYGVPASFEGAYTVQLLPQEETASTEESVVINHLYGYAKHDVSLLRAGDRIRPKIDACLPSSDKAASLSTVVQIFFSKLMSQEATENAVTLRPQNLQSPFYYDWQHLTKADPPHSVLRLIPANSFVPGTIYSVLVLPSACDIYGNQLADSYLHTFTTISGTPGAGVKEDPPEVLATAPTSGESGVSVRPTVSILFSKTMSQEATQNAVTLPAAGAPWRPAWEGSRLFYIPGGTLAVNTGYQIGVSGAAKDWAGNPLVNPQTIDFTTSSTALDTTPPQVLFVTGGKDADLNSVISVYFSEAMDPNTINDNNILIIYSDHDNNLVRLDGQVRWDSAANMATFRPTNELVSMTNFTVIIKTGVTDLAGNEMLREYRTTFVTADMLGPQISNVKFDGRGYVPDDVISPTALISAEVSDPAGLNYNYLNLKLGPSLTIKRTDLKAQDIYGSGVLAYQIAPAIGEGTYQITIEVADARNKKGHWTGRVRIYSGDVALVPGTVVFAAPGTVSPLKDLAAGQEIKVNMVYNLTGSADIDLQIYGPTGLIWARRYAGGTPGGLAGYNVVAWSGRDARGQLASNGLYSFRIVRGGKTLGTGYIVVSD